MLKNHQQKNSESGYSTVEIVVAIFVFAVSLTGVSVLAFGNQSISVDTQQNSEALQIAQKDVETARVEAMESFDSIVTKDCETAPGYTCERQVVASGDNSYKNITTVVSWETEGRDQNVSLSSMVTDLENIEEQALTGNPISDPPGNNSSNNPGGGSTVGTGMTCPLKDTQGGYLPYAEGIKQGNALDVRYDSSTGNTYAYLGSTAGVNSGGVSYFYVVKMNNIASPQILSKLSFTAGNSQAANAVDVAEDAASSKVYAYLGMKSSSSEARPQFQVVDVTDPASSSKVSSLDLAADYGNNSSALSVFYRKNLFTQKAYAYVGTEANSGNEFFVIDVTTPASPVVVGSVAVDGDVNDILVRGNYAYLAVSGTSNYQMTLDVSDPASPVVSGSLAEGSVAGQSLVYLGGKIYLGGKAPQSGLFILDATNPALTKIGSLSSTITTSGVATFGNYAFLANLSDSKTLQAVNISDPTNIPEACLNVGVSHPASGIVYLNDTAYLSLSSAEGMVAIKLK